MNEEISDALHMLLHCALKDKEYETQKEQFEFVYKHIEELHNKIDKANDTIDTNLELIEHLSNKIDKAIEYIKNKQVIDLDYLEEILKG